MGDWTMNNVFSVSRDLYKTYKNCFIDALKSARNMFYKNDEE